jgi:hypothetical protein
MTWSPEIKSLKITRSGFSACCLNSDLMSVDVGHYRMLQSEIPRNKIFGGETVGIKSRRDALIDCQRGAWSCMALGAEFVPAGVVDTMIICYRTGRAVGN